ncbi:TRAP transporter substrate-binding protein [Chloroflexota bacterium]
MGKGVKIVLAVVMIVSVMGLGVTGCAKEVAPTTPTTPTTPTPAKPAPTAPAPVKPITLKYAWPIGTTHYLYPGVAGFKKEIEEKSGGRYKIDVYPAQSLVKVAAGIDSLRTGICDILGTCSSWHPGVFTMDNIYAIPGLVQSGVQATALRNELFNEFNKPQWDKAGVTEVGGRNQPPSEVFSKSKPLYTIEDFKGLSIRTVFQPQAKLMSNLDALPVNMPSVDLYEAMSKGVVDAACFYASSVVQENIYETGKPGCYVIIGGVGSGPYQTFMNKEYFENMPNADQQMFMDAGYEWNTVWVPLTEDAASVDAVEFMMDYGIQVIWWSDAEMARLNKEYKEPLYGEWADEMDADGWPGSAMVAKLQEISPTIPPKYPLDPKWEELKAKAGY